MAAYGTLVAWARVMGHTEAADLLQETLDEEKAADEKLSSLAEGGINQAGGRSRAQAKTRAIRKGRRGRGRRRAGQALAHAADASLHRHDLDVTFAANDGDAEIVRMPLELQIDDAHRRPSGRSSGSSRSTRAAGPVKTRSGALARRSACRATRPA